MNASQKVKGIKNDHREHKDIPEKYPEIRERMQSLLEQGEKITPQTVESRDTIMSSRV